MIKIYTDGACSNNPGFGSYCAIIIDDNNKEEVIVGCESFTTNNRMELKAVVEAIKKIKTPSEIKVFTDSQYVVYGFTQGRIFRWVKNNWKTTTKCEVKNRDLWIELLKLYNTHKIDFIWIKGHANDEYNEKCDKIAKEIIKKNIKK